MGSQRIGHDLSHTHHIQSRFLPLVSYVLRRHGEKKSSLMEPMLGCIVRVGLWGDSANVKTSPH